jgi:hypothetical protein
VDPNAELDPFVRLEMCVARRNAPLDFKKTAHGVDHAGKFDQKPITHRIDDVATVGLDRWINQFGAERAQTTHRPFFVRAGQPRIARDIRRENSR